METKPEKGQLYHHHSGRVYRILHIANEDATKPGWEPTVVYEDIDGHQVWARSVVDWNNSSYTLIK